MLRILEVLAAERELSQEIEALKLEVHLLKHTCSRLEAQDRRHHGTPWPFSPLQLRHWPLSRYRIHRASCRKCAGSGIALSNLQTCAHSLR